LQAAYDLRVAELSVGVTIERAVKPRQATKNSRVTHAPIS